MKIWKEGFYAHLCLYNSFVILFYLFCLDSRLFVLNIYLLKWIFIYFPS